MIISGIPPGLPSLFSAARLHLNIFSSLLLTTTGSWGVDAVIHSFFIVVGPQLRLLRCRQLYSFVGCPTLLVEAQLAPCFVLSCHARLSKCCSMSHLYASHRNTECRARCFGFVLREGHPCSPGADCWTTHGHQTAGNGSCRWAEHRRPRYRARSLCPWGFQQARSLAAHTRISQLPSHRSSGVVPWLEENQKLDPVRTRRLHMVA